ncbi:MAG: hypothetical protein GTO17_08290 [Candidatus Aminicenantes bacterium]|nr:hypothetical protein [Candidatus Aminicenantes bacterium]
MSPEERAAIQALERRYALEQDLERRRAEAEIQKLNEEMNPTTKIQLRKFYNELKDLRVKLPKIVVK